MRFFHSYKKYNWRVGIIRKRTGQRSLSLAAATIVIAALSLGLASHGLFSAENRSGGANAAAKVGGLRFPNFPLLFPIKKSAPVPPAAGGSFSHQNIISTIFWVGEPGDSSNGYIANYASAWDEKWQNHYGGVDDPSHRSGYNPAAFTPKENPFYAALPYNDISENSSRKPTAISCAAYTPSRQENYSWCKNIWIKLRHGSKVAYAQWEDVGPFEEDDYAYVFGSAQPVNNTDARAGIDVSPAVRDFFGLNDIDKLDWSLAAPAEVPEGPWKQITTTSFGSSLD